jgi:hypothetical protein
MFKKFFNIKKTTGTTYIYYIVKSNNYLDNSKISISIDNTTPVSPAVIDVVHGKYVFHAKKVEFIKSFNYVLQIESMDLDFSNILPIPIKKALGNEHEDFLKKIAAENPQSKLEFFQSYRKT